MDADQTINQEAPEEDEELFIFGNGVVWPEEVDKFLLKKDPERKANLKSIVIKGVTNEDAKIKIVTLNEGCQEEDHLQDDKNQIITHLAYYVDKNSTVTERKNLVFPTYQNYINHTDCNELSDFHKACATGNTNNIKQFLNNGESIHRRFISNDNSDKRNKFTPLHFAVAHHNIDVVKFLLERGADINATDSSGITALHLACAVSWYFKKSKSRQVLDNYTCWAADLDILELLLEHKCQLNCKDHNGNTPLLSVFKNDYYGPLNVDEMMIQDLVAIDNLARFLQIKQIGKFALLFNKCADITAKNYDDESILHCVIEDLTSRRIAPSNKSDCDGAYAQIIRVLLEVDLDVVLDVNAKNKKGETPLALAVSLLNYDIVKILLDHNADLSCLKIRDHHFFRYPNTPLTVNLIKNLAKIMSSLAHKEFIYTREDNLAVLKFLAHDVDDCDCALTSFSETLQAVSQLIFYGSAAHTKHVVLKCYESSNVLLKQSLFTTIVLFVDFCKIVSCPFYIDEEILKMLHEYVGNEEPILQACGEDVSLLKSTMLNNGLTLYDIMTKSPSIAEIPKYLNGDDVDFDVTEQPFKNRFIPMSIHHRLKKLRVRMYIASAALEIYISLLLPAFPEKCLRMILDCLDNEDILRLCAAALLD